MIPPLSVLIFFESDVSRVESHLGRPQGLQEYVSSLSLCLMNRLLQ